MILQTSVLTFFNTALGYGDGLLRPISCIRRGLSPIILIIVAIVINLMIARSCDLGLTLNRRRNKCVSKPRSHRKLDFRSVCGRLSDLTVEEIPR